MSARILFLIVAVAIVLRFFDLGGVPVGFHRDEANFGYNAYTLLKTGRDITGNFLPLHIDSFLHSPAGYSYFSIPFVALFGLNEFSVRFASALFGSATVLLTYFLVKGLFASLEENKAKTLALISAFFLAISPWHINLSRVATENVLVVFFLVLGTLLYLQWLKKERVWLLIACFLSFGITLLLYQAPRAFLPFFIPLLFLFYHPVDWKKKLYLPLVLFIITIILPIMLILSSKDLTERVRMLSIFQNPATQLVLDEQIRENGTNDVMVTRFFHNKIVNYSITFFSNYFNHFSYDFLFTDKGLPDRYRVPQMGLLYFFELPLLLFGIWKLAAADKNKALFFGGWILLAPLGSAFTFDDVPNLQRTLMVFPALSIIIAFGFLSFWTVLAKKKFGRGVQALVIISILFGVLYYLQEYYVIQVHHRPWFRQEGYKTLVSKINDMQANYKKVVITDGESDPVIFFLFYNRYNPADLATHLKSYPESSYVEKSFDKYEFVVHPCPLHITGEKDRRTKQPILSGEKGILYVNRGTCELSDARIQTIAAITRNDGTVVFLLQTVK